MGSKTNTAPSQPIVARRAKVKDNVNRTRMLMKITPFVKDDPVLDTEAWQWLTLVNRTDHLEGYELPTPDSKPEVIYDAFLAYLEMDAVLQEDWQMAVEDANSTTNKSNLLPPELVATGEKKDTLESESSNGSG